MSAVDPVAAAKRHYAWVIVAVTFVVLVAAAGIRATPSVLIKPLGDDMGWSPALVGGAVSVNLLLYGATAPFAAAIVERYGMRRVCTAALLLIAAGASLTSLMTEPWQLYLLWGVVVGGCTGALSVPLASIVANHWFVARRGLVTGVLSASMASGQLVFLPLLAWLVDAKGWRGAGLLVGGFAIIVVAPLALIFLRDRPEDKGLFAYGATESLPQRSLAGNPFASAIAVLRQASQERDFWLLAGAFFICGATTNGLVGTHLIAACSDHGISAITGAGLLAAIGIFDLVGTICSGWLTDRYDPRWLLFWYYGLRGLSLIGLNAALASAGVPLVVFIVFYGLDWVATVPPTVALCRQRFGPEKASVVFAWVFSAHQFGAAAAAWGAGASRTWLDSYTPAFIVAGALGVGAAAMSVIFGRRLLLRPLTPA